MQPNGTQEQRVAAGWAGSMNIPREVVLAQDGTVRFFPIREIDSLHLGEPVRLEGEEVDGAQLSGRSLDLRIAGVLGEAPIELDLLASQDGSCATRITLSRRQAKGMSGQEAWTGWLSVDRSSAADADSPWRGEDTRLLQGPVPSEATAWWRCVCCWTVPAWRSSWTGSRCQSGLVPTQAMTRCACEPRGWNMPHSGHGR